MTTIDGAGAGAGIGAGGAAQETGTSRHTTSSNPTIVTNLLFIRASCLLSLLYYNADGKKRLGGFIAFPHPHPQPLPIADNFIRFVLTFRGTFRYNL